jgi:hypothetical protein
MEPVLAEFVFACVEWNNCWQNLFLRAWTMTYSFYSNDWSNFAPLLYHIFPLSAWLVRFCTLPVSHILRMKYSFYNNDLAIVAPLLYHIFSLSAWLVKFCTLTVSHILPMMGGYLEPAITIAIATVLTSTIDTTANFDIHNDETCNTAPWQQMQR